MANEKETLLTKEGLQELEKELNRRKGEERERILKDIADARSQGDLSENADYTSARENQVKNEQRISEIEEIIKNVKIIRAKKIVVRLNNGPEQTYEIRGSESDPFKNHISSESPLARACEGHTNGDEFNMHTESGKDISVKLIKSETI